MSAGIRVFKVTGRDQRWQHSSRCPNIFYALLNRGESRHAVARAICHGQKGEIRKRYTDGQEDQLGTLGLVTNAVVLWNTIYMQAALDHLRAQGETLNDEDIARLSPLCHGHINMLGHYSFTLAELVTKGHLRPLKEASEAENVA
uniref:Tn3 transposase DDE domain protein n=1 Tax=Klebsiella pneumoniae TaxID=573 RepID=A0A1X9QCH6_KLEPN|nr:Tn3 transposase DDE domain protein [Klebsiella pneumoniae]